MTAEPEIDAGAYHKAARVRRLVDRAGAARLPGYERLIRSGRRRIFRVPDDEDADIRVRTNGLVLKMPAGYRRLYLSRPYEPVTTALVQSVLRLGDVVVDVGANVGYYSCLAARAVRPTGVVHSIEPSSDNLRLLRENLARNGCANVRVHPVAAAGRAETRSLQLAAHSGHHSFHRHPLSETLGVEEVQARPLDELVDPPARVIKVDVEGAEPEVLFGMRRLLEASAGATVVVEWAPAALKLAGHDPCELPALMRSLGVTELRAVDDWGQRLLPVPEAVRQVREGATDDAWYVNLCGRVVR